MTFCQLSARTAAVASVLWLAACASSEVATYSALPAEEIAAQVTVSRAGDNVSFVAPALKERESFGGVAAGMFTGGADLGSNVALHGERSAAGVTSHRLITQVQYTNLGGVYRDYDRAGIAGIPEVPVVRLERNRHASGAGGVHMTEKVAMEILESDLRARAQDGFELRLSDDSGNLVELTVPASYISGYLLRMDSPVEAPVLP